MTQMGPHVFSFSVFFLPKLALPLHHVSPDHLLVLLLSNPPKGAEHT